MTHAASSDPDSSLPPGDQTLRIHHFGGLGIAPDLEDAYVEALRHGTDRLSSAVVAQLVQAGLAVRSGAEVATVPPQLVIEQWSAHQQAALAAARRGVQVYRHLAPGNDHAQLEVVRGQGPLTELIQRMQEEAVHEVLAFHREPYYDSALSTAQPAAMERGVTYRVVYRESVLADPAVNQTVRQGVDLGEQARTYPDLPVRLQITDERLALVIMAVEPEGSSARDVIGLVVHPSPLLASLRELFHTFWNLAIPIESEDAQGRGGNHDDAQHQVLTLLAMGLTDESIGRELGVSPRTVQRRISRLQQQLGASSRFMLGVQAVRLGHLST